MFCDGHFFFEMAICPAVCSVLSRVISADFAHAGFKWGLAPLVSRKFVSASGGLGSEEQFSSSEDESVLLVAQLSMLRGVVSVCCRFCAGIWRGHFERIF